MSAPLSMTDYATVRNCPESKRGTRIALLNWTDRMAVETTLRNEIARARTITDHLFRAVRIEAMYDRPIPERHRIVFYIGHLEAFDWNLIGTELEEPRFHPEFDRLFSFGIDPDASALPADIPSDWPELDEVHQYVRRVRRELDRILDR